MLKPEIKLMRTNPDPLSVFGAEIGGGGGYHGSINYYIAVGCIEAFTVLRGIVFHTLRI